MRNIKGLVEVAPQAVTTAVKTFVQVAYACATWIMLRNIWARNMRGATCIMRDRVSAVMCGIYAGDMRERWHDRGKLSG